MKKTAKAPANIAFIKYWGKKDEELRTPMNSSISMNLSGAFTTTTVEFNKKYKTDLIEMMHETLSEKERGKIIKHLNRIREFTKTNLFARVMTQNTFPKSAGMASSASGFAALTVAAAAASGVEVSEKDLTILARLGSGSACRSIPDGYVKWDEGHDSNSSDAYCLFPATHWDLADIICIVETGPKKVSTTDGMAEAASSPHFVERLNLVKKEVPQVVEAIKNRDIQALGPLIEADASSMMQVMATQIHPLIYRNEVSDAIISEVVQWREMGVEVYWTLDAGPNVHLICEQKDMKKVAELATSVKGVIRVIENKVAPGTQLIESHLF